MSQPRKATLEEKERGEERGEERVRVTADPPKFKYIPPPLPGSVDKQEQEENVQLVILTLPVLLLPTYKHPPFSLSPSEHPSKSTSSNTTLLPTFVLSATNKNAGLLFPPTIALTTVSEREKEEEEAAREKKEPSEMVTFSNPQSVPVMGEDVERTKGE
jgi:hypothetical protein